MRRCGWLVLGAVLLAACDNSTKSTAPRGPFVMAGKYVLQTVNGQSLPFHVQGDTVINSDSLVLSVAYTFKHWQTITTAGVTKEITEDGTFVSTLTTPDSVSHLSVLRQTPSYKTYAFSISKSGVATIADVNYAGASFTFVFDRQ